MLRALASLPLLFVLMHATAAAQETGRKYALLVGVDKYPRTGLLSSLEFPERDVEELAKVLAATGYAENDVRVMTRTRGFDELSYLPSAANIGHEIKLLLADKQPVDTVLIVLSGHGVLMPVTRAIEGKSVTRDETLFCPIDADLRSKDPRTFISLDLLYQQLEACPARVKFVLSDACRNQAFAGARPGGINLPPPATPPKTVAAMFSCSQAEVAYEDKNLAGGHGVFLHYVIEGLKGAADANGDGNVTSFELAEYSSRKVGSHVRERFGNRQTPELKGNSQSVTLARVESRRADGLPAATSIVEGPVPNSIDVSYIADNFHAALVLRPGKLLDSHWPHTLRLAFPNSDFDQFKATFQQQLGFSLGDLDEVTLLCDLGGAGEQMDIAVAGILRFSAPYNRAEVAQRIAADGAQLRQIGGHDVYHQAGRGFALVNEKLILIGDLPILPGMLNYEGDRSPLIDGLRATPRGHDIALFVDCNKWIQKINEGAPADLKPFFEVAAETERIRAVLDVDGPKLFTANARFQTDASVVKALDLIRLVLPRSAAGIDAQDKALSMYLGEFLTGDERTELADLAIDLRSGVDLSSAGPELTIEVTAPADFTRRIEKLQPALTRAAAAARQASEEMHRMKNLALALHNYHDAHGSFPPAVVRDANGKPLYSWRVALLPYIDGDVQDDFKMDEPWDSPHNKALLKRIPPLYRSSDSDEEGKTQILAVVGPQTVLTSAANKVGIRHVQDGTSQTIAFVSASPEAAVPWSAPQDLDAARNDLVRLLGNPQSRTFRAAFADGHVQSLDKQLPAETLKALFTRDGHEVIHLPD